MADIERGARTEVRDADATTLVRRALSGVVDHEIHGEQLAVVWASTEEEWEAAQAEGREPEGNAWPAENVRAL